jgi:hypothetical protein
MIPPRSKSSQTKSQFSEAERRIMRSDGPAAWLLRGLAQAPPALPGISRRIRLLTGPAHGSLPGLDVSSHIHSGLSAVNR